MNMTPLESSYLAKDAYDDRAKDAVPDAKPIPIGDRVYNVIAYANTHSGYQGTAYRDVLSGEVTIANRGTEVTTEFIRDVALADGGMVAKAVNAQSDDALMFAKRAIHDAKELAAIDGKPLAITAVGHSLGGTLAQIQAHHLGIRLKVTAGDARPAAGPAPGEWRSDIHSLHRSSTHR